MKRLTVYWTLRFAAGILAILPERVAVHLGHLGGWIAWLVAGDKKQMAIRHMERLGAGASAERKARRMYAAYGRYWAEALWMRPRRAGEARERITVDGLDRVLAARDAGAGVVFALPHLGNWEVAGTIAQSEHIELMAVAENLRNRRLVDWFIKLRNMLGIQIVLADGSREVFKKLLAVIGRGGAIALLCDRDLNGRGVEVEFFGEMTTLPGGAISIGIRTGAPVIPVGTYFRDGRGHHIIVGRPIDIPSEGSMDERVAGGVRELAAAFEALIRRAPEQWHLLQPNWPSDREIS
ncbi:MAG: phosphatidylinositol mannoside acyltransferase [Acidimicrobiia bacterium]|nr:phosphatidylinositol mannoside acyltransferase [Acidimicrobiia bacterium]